MPLLNFQLCVSIAAVIIAGTVQSIPIRRVARASSSAVHASDSIVKISNSTLEYFINIYSNSTGLVPLWLGANNLTNENFLKIKVSYFAYAHA